MSSPFEQAWLLLKDIGEMAMQNNYPQDPPGMYPQGYPGMSQRIMPQQGPASSEFVPEEHMQELRDAMLQQQIIQHSPSLFKWSHLITLLVE